MQLEKLMQVMDKTPVTTQDVKQLEIAGLTCDSRQVRPGYLFAALPGSAVDGRDYIEQALDKGAKAILAPPGSSVGSTHTDIPVIEDKNPRRLFAKFAARFHDGQPHHVSAITGTNGKTSVATFYRQICTSLRKSAGSMGTLGVEAPGMTVSGTLTTPDSAALHEIMKRLADNGITHLAMEASSHGLNQYRLDGVRVSSAAFTNLSRDHLDYHGSMDQYLAAKSRLFSEVMVPGGKAVLNADIPEFKVLKTLCDSRQHQIIDYGYEGRAIQLNSVVAKATGQALGFEIDGHRYNITLPLVGEFQAMNALCALGLALAEGAKAAEAVEALTSLQGVRGRLELAAHLEGDRSVYVDYAHTPDALETVLKALRPHTDGRLVVVFGCGGDRDKGKRPQMGQIANNYANATIITDDNPRSEDPAPIRQEIKAACPEASVIGDRRHAITEGIKLLEKGDILLVAGKGHESGQIIGDQVLPFNDKEVITEIVKSIGGDIS